MIFTIDQLIRFKEYAHRTMVRIEEWKNNRDVQVGRIAEEIQGAFSEGYHTAMREVQSTPWEYLVLYAASNTQETLNAASADGWEFLCPFDGSKVLFRRRKAVADIAAQEKSQ